MSAIWGAISLGESLMEKTKARAMKKSYDRCIIDKIEEYENDNMLLGCGLQYFTKESEKETLPFLEEENRIYYTADVLLDNRKELADKLELKDYENIPDGEILFEIYKKYGHKCLNWILGSYVFVYCDSKTNEISIVTASTGTRCLYYKYQKGVFCFSSLVEALLEKGEPKKLNKRWMADFLAMDSLVGITECEETMYQNIYKVPPACVMTVTENGIKKECYWKPDMNTTTTMTDEECKEEVIKVFREAVTCLLRGEKNAMMLSGGLDSSSVACFAAPELKKRGEILYTFTSIPEKEYVSDMSSYNVTDESEKVKKTAEFLGNLECHFVNLQGKDSWIGHYEIKEALEMPYKSPQNLQWLIESLKQAYNIGARIVLVGGYGNVTISYGNPELQLGTLLYQKQFITFLKEYSYYPKKYHWGKKKSIKMLQEILKEHYKKEEKEQNIIGGSYINEKVIEEFQVKYRLQKLYEEREPKKKNLLSFRMPMIDFIQFGHKGEIKTKESLMTGVIFRDPCMDKRVIELCLKFSMKQFCYHGVCRRIVREHFKGIVPEHITNVHAYGCQSADMLMKVQKNWTEIKQSMLNVFERNRENEMVDVNRAIKDLENLEKDFSSNKKFDYIRLFYTAMALEFMEQME